MIIQNNLEVLLKHAAYLRNMQVKVFSAYLHEDKFSNNEVNILIILMNNPSIDTAKELVLFLGVSKGLVCRSLDRLLAKKYIRMQADKEDRRIQRITLQESANTVMKQIAKARKEVETQLLQGIPEEQLHICEQVFQTIAKNAKVVEENMK